MKFLNRVFPVLAALFLSVAISSCGKTELKKRTLGYKGEARANAFLAAQRYLRNMGYEVESQAGFGKLSDEVSTMFLPPSALNTVGRGKRIMDWVDEGGHIVVMLKGGGKRGNDFAPNNVYDADTELKDELPGVDYILEQIGVTATQWTNEDAERLGRDEWEKLSEPERVLGNSEPSTFSFAGEDQVIYQWSDKLLEYNSDEAKEQYCYVNEYYGDGLVTVLTDASPLRNRYIGYAGHSAFLNMLVDQSGTGKIIFSNGVGDGLFSLIWRYFKFAVIGLAVVIVFWLWKNLPRFGPEQDLPESQMREFSTQVQGVGRFLWKQKREDAMLSALRGSVNKHLSVGSYGDSDAVFAQLAESSSLPLESVVEAMTRNNIREHSVMVRVVKHLQIILKTIN